MEWIKYQIVCAASLYIACMLAIQSTSGIDGIASEAFEWAYELKWNKDTSHTKQIRLHVCGDHVNGKVLCWLLPAANCAQKIATQAQANATLIPIDKSYKRPEHNGIKFVQLMVCFCEFTSEMMERDSNGGDENWYLCKWWSGLSAIARYTHKKNDERCERRCTYIRRITVNSFTPQRLRVIAHAQTAYTWSRHK